jgi:hypothetical protein
LVQNAGWSAFTLPEGADNKAVPHQQEHFHLRSAFVSVFGCLPLEESLLFAAPLPGKLRLNLYRRGADRFQRK